MTFDLGRLYASLPVMGMGMLGIFVVILIIFLVTLGVSKLSRD